MKKRLVLNGQHHKQTWSQQMIFNATIEHSEGDEYVATCLQPFAQGHGLSPTNALDQLRRELRYQIEMCPCSGIDPDSIEIATPQGL